MSLFGLILALVTIIVFIGNPNLANAIPIIVSIYIRMVVGLIPVVVEVIRSNDLSEKMLESLLKPLWTNTNLTNQRLGVSLAIIQKPLRATILYQQPSSAQIYTAIGGAVLSTFATLFSQVRVK